MEINKFKFVTNISINSVNKLGHKIKYALF